MKIMIRVMFIRTMFLFILFTSFSLISCRKINWNVNIQEGNFSQVMHFHVNATNRQLLFFHPPQLTNPYKIRAWIGDCSLEHPVLVVVEQESDVFSWQVPLVLSDFGLEKTLYFDNTSRTLCDNNLVQKNPGNIQNFTVGLSTSSPSNVSFYLEVEEELQFYIKNNKSYRISVSPSQPQYFFYKFNSTRNSSIIIKVDSPDDVCLTISIQDNHCPVFDLDTEISFAGVHATIERKGGMRISRKNYRDGFFLVFVAKIDDDRCLERSGPFSYSLLRQKSNRTSIVNFNLTEGIDDQDYISASLIILGALSVVWLFAITVVCIFHFFVNNSDTENWDTLESSEVSSQSDAEETIANNESRQELVPPQRAGEIAICNDRNVFNFSRQVNENRRRARNYFWHILNIAVFYSIPAIQLVITYQNVVNHTGNADICYYNFLCANPVGFLSDFNHVYSNIGYGLMGILFLIIVLHRQVYVRKRTTGIPVHYGVFYAMGSALIIEGILSASYHVCPNQSNFQFDTSFMYVMAVLCLVKLYQNRHSDIIPSAYSTFAVLGVTIFIGMIGIVNNDQTVILGSLVIVIYVLFCGYISLKVYYFGWVVKGLKQLCEEFHEHDEVRETIRPREKVRFICLLVANIINGTMLVCGIILYYYQFIDFATFLLILLMGNAFLYALIYTCMKVNYERISIQAAIYGVVGLAFWIAAAICFVNGGIEWTEAPAESRELNQDCIFLNFYDRHDLWHLFSAVALYFTFMFLLCIDDNVIHMNRNEMLVF